jgi:formylglycine-generating enzyme required for sulfatase activity
MKPAAPGDTQPLSPLQPPLRLLRWQARTQVFHEELGGAERLTMVRIPAGSFLMGSAEQEPGRHANEGPLHTVSLAEFLIGQTPITQAQWRAVARWQERPGERWGRELNPKLAKFQGEEARLLAGAGEMNTDERPVERVSWEDAIEFCSRLSQRTKRNYTLPSEAQWEYACRAGTSTAYCFGAIIYSDLANFRGTDASHFSSPTPDPQPLYREQTTPVGMFPANAWGLHDMHGNVLEWCMDSVRSSYEGGPYDGSAWQDPQAPKEQQRITRGGSWSMLPKYCRSAFRSLSRRDVSDGPYDDVGFRVVCLPPSTRAGEKLRLDRKSSSVLADATKNRIYISYRRDDARGASGRVLDWLRIGFGRERVFRDLASIGTGKWREKIDQALAASTACVVVIGRRWADDTNLRRLNDKNDLVRYELEMALAGGERQDLVLVPILVEGASLREIRVNELPESLQPLLEEWNVLELSESCWEDDIRRMIEAISAATGLKVQPELEEWLSLMAGSLKDQGSGFSRNLREEPEGGTGDGTDRES